MKILFISKSFPVHGGVERWLKDLILGLISSGIDVDLALADGQRFHHAQDYIDAYPELSGLDIHLIDGKLGLPRQRRQFISKLIVKLKPDIVVPVLLQDGLEVAIEQKNKGDDLKIIYPVHENDIWVYDVIRTYKNAIDLLVSVNQLFLKLVETRDNWPEDRLEHIRCGASMPKSRAKLMENGILRIGYCGKVNDKQKRAGDIAELCIQLDQKNIGYSFTIAGTGSGEELLKERLADEIAEGKVVFRSYLSEKELYKSFYPELDILFIPSYWETGPIVAWEAMLHGVVVLSSKYRGSQCEGILINNETSLLFPIGDIETAVQQTRLLDQDREMLRHLGANGRCIAEKELTVERMVEKWINTLQKIHKRPPLLSGKEHQDNNGFVFSAFSQRLVMWARIILRRPVFHGNSHLEWPRYQSGHCSKKEIDAFDKLLREVERGCTGERN